MAGPDLWPLVPHRSTRLASPEYRYVHVARCTLIGMSLLRVWRNTGASKVQGNVTNQPDDERARLWNWALHEDDLLTTRVSVFLLAESILIAVTATVINSLSGLHSVKSLLRVEVFGFASMLILAGIALTLIFWYILNLNYQGLKVLMNRMKKLDSMYRDLDAERREGRDANWYYRKVFHRGANDTINNLLPLTLLIIWCVIGIFAIVIFISH